MELFETYHFNYQKIFKFLTRRGNNGYLFAIADDYRFINEVNTSLSADLKQRGIKTAILFFTNDTDEPLIQQLNNTAAHTQAIMVANLYEIINNGEQGLSQLLVLNFAREELRALKVPILFWADAKSLHKIANHAPDLFSQRRISTVHFAGKVTNPLEEVYQKSGWDEHAGSNKPTQSQAKADTLKRRLTDAEEAGYNKHRIASEIALPLANEYAELGFTEDALPLLEKYDGYLDVNNSTQLQQLAKIYYLLQQYPLAIDSMQKANAAIEVHLFKSDSTILYPRQWFDNSIAMTGWMKEFDRADEALTLLTKAIALLAANIGDYPPEWASEVLATLVEQTGAIYLLFTNIKKAQEQYEQSIAIREELVRTNPNSDQLQKNLAESYLLLGDIYKRNGDLHAAKKCFEKSVAINQDLKKTAPDTVQYKRALFLGYEKLGAVSQELGDVYSAQQYLAQGERTINGN